MYSLQEAIKEITPSKTLSRHVQQTIGIARSSGGIVTQETIDALISIEKGELTVEESIQEVIREEGIKVKKQASKR